MCKANTDSFLSFQINILGYTCDDSLLYFSLLFVYALFILGAHKLNTTIRQKHREALAQLPGSKRNITCLVLLNILHSLLHICFVLFIASNNLGFIIVSVVFHAIGTAIVYNTQRSDHKHPLKAIAMALRHIDKSDKDTIQDVQYILEFIKDRPLKM